LQPGQLAALDQALAAYRRACRAFADGTGTGEEFQAAAAQLRRAGLDEVAGLITLPVAAIRFTDLRADGARISAVSGSVLGGEVWVCWTGRGLPSGIEPRTYDAWDLIQVRA